MEEAQANYHLTYADVNCNVTMSTEFSLMIYDSTHVKQIIISTSWRRILLEEHIVTQLLNHFPTI
jgi:hypothetical protein